MSRETAVPCIICGATLESVSDDAYNQPYGGTCFNSHGQYGSTVFDPLNGEYLEVNICDNCLRAKAGEGHVLHGRDKVPVVHDGSVFGWTTRRWELFPWDPDAERSEEVVTVEDWDDFQRTRDQWPIETRFSDGELKRMFQGG